MEGGQPGPPRVLALADRYADSDYEHNPKPEIFEDGDVSICQQPLLAGGDYATAWKEKASGDPLQSTLYVSTANEIPAAGVSARVAKLSVEEGAALEIGELEKEHRQWWHEYFRRSFLSIPDARMESFYWIQVYKMGSCSRADGPALDLNGPFLKITQWPSLWWNLNVQLTYWPFNTSNHQDIAINYIHLIDEYFDTMLENRFSGSNLGDFAWALHNYWLYYSYQGDTESIREKWVPKAMRVVEVYEGKLIKDESGKIGSIEMGSPEYMGFRKFKNTNYNLALLRWLLNELIESSETAGINAAEVERWKQILEDLIPYPVDENGLMIGSDQAVDITSLFPPAGPLSLVPAES